MKKQKYEKEQLIVAIIKWAEFVKGLGIKWETGIYPGEMAAFLALCELEGVDGIIESGRGDHAYSTQILAEYGQIKNVPIISIDMARVSKQTFRDKLEEYKNLKCLTGNAFTILPRAMHKLKDRIALLVDGPKMEIANRLSFTASAMFNNICIVAHHNCHVETPWGKEFGDVFPGMFHYEDLMLDDLSEWREFKEWEAAWVGNYELYDETHQVIGRSLDASSLAMTVVSPGQRPTRDQVVNLKGDQFQYSPSWLWIKWSVLRWF